MNSLALACAGQGNATASQIVVATEALNRLKAGNARFTAGQSLHPHEMAAWRQRLQMGQHPYATVVGCADSRVPIELLFDAGFGDLFVIRVAGNIAAPDVIASVEYAIDHLSNKLVLVLGHENCGAVSAALAAPAITLGEPPELRGLLSQIRPGLGGVTLQLAPRERVAGAVEANVKNSVHRLRNVPSIQLAIKNSGVSVVGGVYSLTSGKVDFFEP